MKVLHVVTLISPDGAFGGPVRVALNLSRAAAELGDDVVIAAATRGWERSPDQIDGVRVRLFAAARVPGLGLAGIFSPGLMRWLIANVRRFDVVHVHFTRDLVAVPAALLTRALGVPFVLQTHGMVDPSDRPAARLLDWMAVRRLLLSAGRVLDLTDVEREGLQAVVRGRSLRSARLINGTFPAPDRGQRDPAGFPSVLFLSRLHARKRPGVFVEMATIVHEQLPDACFALVGPDEGEAETVHQLISRHAAGDYVRYEGALAPDAALERMQAADLFVLPSVDEVFPMAVLEALGAGVPVVVGSSAAMAARIETVGAGAVPRTDDASAYAEAVMRIVGSREAQSEAAARARRLAEDEFSMRTVAADLHDIHQDAAAQSSTRRPPS